MTEPLPSGDEAALRQEITRLNKVVQALMNRAERETSTRSGSFGLFQDAVMLENQIRRRTAELEAALRENERINRDLTREKDEQRKLIRKLEEAHNQLLQSEKLASIGQLAAGVAHEINNPIGFVNSNLGTLKNYADQLLGLLDEYAKSEAELSPETIQRLAQARQVADIDFVREDMAALIAESMDGAGRVRRIVQDLRDFSRPGDSEWTSIDLHTCIDSTLNVVWNEIKFKADVVRDYGQLPPVECLPFQLNQVFLNLLVNAAHAIPERGTITIRTSCDGDHACVAITDTGTGMAPEVRDRIFDPFFTTKPVGKGTGLGLSVAYGIVDKHNGRIEVDSAPDQGTTFTIRLPLKRG
jgi:two-component system, NtrC family, sensor kinase